jgi:hypothetical protein
MKMRIRVKTSVVQKFWSEFTRINGSWFVMWSMPHHLGCENICTFVAQQEEGVFYMVVYNNGTKNHSFVT